MPAGILRSDSEYFYPRSPCGERRPTMQRALGVFSISIHALLAESDQPNPIRNNKHNIFLSTLSLRRATEQSASYNAYLEISIHALLAESDPRTGLTCGGGQNISIHALLAESDYSLIAITPSNFSFLSTLSLRRATAKVHKTVGHFCAYETNFMGIASSC